ncbi:exo-1,3-beta-glucanase [Podila horticola]|nr:exo-1,3-beta-glucanase [Podila horticola]
MFVKFLGTTLLFAIAIWYPSAAKVSAEPIRGVVLGGLFVLEPWITPSLFSEWASNQTVVDEYTYCSVLGKEECSARLQKHWKTWVTEDDIHALSSYGLTSLRIPIGYWALISIEADEPYVSGQLDYLKIIFQWAKKYSCDVHLVLQGVPGSQNGFDNSGRRGGVHWQDSAKNFDRSIEAIKVLAQISNESEGVVAAIEVVNEPLGLKLGKTTVKYFYDTAYKAIRLLSSDVPIVFHNAFYDLADWTTDTSLRSELWKNVYLDIHIYQWTMADFLKMSEDEHIKKAAEDGQIIANSNRTIRTMCGEFSLAITDCTLWLNGLGKGAAYDGSYSDPDVVPVVHGTCEGKNDYSTPNYKDFLKKFFAAQRDAYEKSGSGWFFNNFKTEQAGVWNYIELVKAGVIPTEWDSIA